MASTRPFWHPRAMLGKREWLAVAWTAWMGASQPAFADPDAPRMSPERSAAIAECDGMTAKVADNAASMAKPDYMAFLERKVETCARAFPMPPEEPKAPSWGAAGIAVPVGLAVLGGIAWRRRARRAA